MKTGAEWIMDFDESTQTKIITNIENEISNGNNNRSREIGYPNILEFLREAFSWQYSQEGYEYWRKLYYSLEEEEE